MVIAFKLGIANWDIFNSLIVLVSLSIFEN